MWLFYDFLSLKNDVNVPSKSTKSRKAKKLEKNKFSLTSWRSLTKIAGSGSVPKSKISLDPQHCFECNWYLCSRLWLMSNTSRWRNPNIDSGIVAICANGYDYNYSKLVFALLQNRNVSKQAVVGTVILFVLSIQIWIRIFVRIRILRTKNLEKNFFFHCSSVLWLQVFRICKYSFKIRIRSSVPELRIRIWEQICCHIRYVPSGTGLLKFINYELFPGISLNFRLNNRDPDP